MESGRGIHAHLPDLRLAAAVVLAALARREQRGIETDDAVAPPTAAHAAAPPPRRAPLTAALRSSLLVVRSRLVPLALALLSPRDPRLPPRRRPHPVVPLGRPVTAAAAATATATAAASAAASLLVERRLRATAHHLVGGRSRARARTALLALAHAAAHQHVSRRGGDRRLTVAAPEARQQRLLGGSSVGGDASRARARLLVGVGDRFLDVAGEEEVEAVGVGALIWR